MRITDSHFFDRIHAALLPADAELICDRLAPPWFNRQRILNSRDDAIRSAAVVICGDLKPTAAARRLAWGMARYLASAWREHAGGLPADASAIHLALYKIAILNQGNGIGWRQISNILSSNRGR